MTDRYVFICDPADQAAETQAFALARALTDNGQKPLTYLAPSVRDFGMFDFALDQAHIRKLINRKFADLKIGAEEIVTYQTIRPFSVQGVVLGLRCIPEAIQKMDECVRATDIVFVSFYAEEGKAWAKKYGAKIMSNTATVK